MTQEDERCRKKRRKPRIALMRVHEKVKEKKGRHLLLLLLKEMKWTYAHNKNTIKTSAPRTTTTVRHHHPSIIHPITHTHHCTAPWPRTKSADGSETLRPCDQNRGGRAHP